MSETSLLLDPAGEPDPRRIASRRGLSQVLVGAVGCRLARCPDVRSDVVAGARARLVAGAGPTADEVAGAVLRGLVLDHLA